jgi:hypothetical protein
MYSEHEALNHSGWNGVADFLDKPERVCLARAWYKIMKWFNTY